MQEGQLRLSVSLRPMLAAVDRNEDTGKVLRAVDPLVVNRYAEAARI
jgi:hypothetical protein